MSDQVVSKPAVDADGERVYQQPIVARALRNTFHFWKFFVMGLLVFGFGGVMFLKDGLYTYPQSNKKIEAINAQIAAMEKEGKGVEQTAPLKTQLTELGKYHSNLDLLIQIGIGAVCTPLGAWMLWRHLRSTSGHYLLENNVLRVPRHPPVPIDAITAIRNAKWMSKGLAYFDYKTPEGAAGTLTLDALAYEPKPSDAIHDELVRNLRLRTGADVKTSKELKKD
jgi:hypothetical protein